ncbi:anti-sigma factor [Dactylosporangium aurantiacum]|uniref:Anti-sigma factor n=1 Tax=Dactylosporangium aurantiacum TaxID=35754 RepID=A0A9Q9ID75_9ACTN|nr:anti-sigma factor [Dactylosporangium aurantiacum]MDG6109571.1 anti-sigma factor [Dactylosporangium aurantiacum]UWZ51274.1 anti-sigma factor [Dactylosporangium aurantiacum]
MPHLDGDRLIQRALNDLPLTRQEAGHLEHCARCGAQIDRLRHVAAQGRHTQSLRDLPAPPQRVWDRIQAELGATGRGAPPPVRLHTDPPPYRPAMRLFDERAHRRVPPAGRRRGPGRLATVVAVAAAAAVAAVVSVIVVIPRSTAPSAAAPCAGVAEVRLETLPGVAAGVTGYACLRTVGGQRRLYVHTTGMPSRSDGDYEAWLLDATSLNGPVLRMEALGVMDGSGGQDFPVSASLDLASYRVLDISAEPHDGNAAHSGRSLLRGTVV